MEPAGFLNAPYEPAAHVPIKSRSFTDKDGKPLDSCKPVQLAQVTPPCTREDLWLARGRTHAMHA